MRHDRSMCMTMETVMPFGNDAWFRFLFGWALPPKMSLLKASRDLPSRFPGTDGTSFARCWHPAYEAEALPADGTSLCKNH